MADYHRSDRWLASLPEDIRSLVERHKVATKRAEQRALVAERQVRDLTAENKRLRVELAKAKSEAAHAR